jgi:hypothetical protein
MQKKPQPLHNAGHSSITPPLPANQQFEVPPALARPRNGSASEPSFAHAQSLIVGLTPADAVAHRLGQE